MDDGDGVSDADGGVERVAALHEVKAPLHEPVCIELFIVMGIVM